MVLDENKNMQRISFAGLGKGLLTKGSEVLSLISDTEARGFVNIESDKDLDGEFWSRVIGSENPVNPISLEYTIYVPKGRLLNVNIP